MLNQPTHCLKVNREGVTLYLSTKDRKYARGDYIPTPAGVVVEEPGWSNTGLLAIDFSQTLLNYEPPEGVTGIEVPVSGGSGEPHAFLPAEYKMAPGPVYDMVSSFVEAHFTHYQVPVDKAKALAVKYLDDIRNRNPQD